MRPYLKDTCFFLKVFDKLYIPLLSSWMVINNDASKSHYTKHNNHWWIHLTWILNINNLAWSFYLKENSYQSNIDIGCVFKLLDCLTWSRY
jgi:hypothetical protein